MKTGFPWTRGNVAVKSDALSACSLVIGRMETTKGPENTPAGVVIMLVLYMGTFLGFLARYETAGLAPTSSLFLLRFFEREVDDETDDDESEGDTASSCKWRIGIPFRSRSSSNEKEHPTKKPTQSFSLEFHT
jgi:hypothetical protein